MIKKNNTVQFVSGKSIDKLDSAVYYINFDEKGNLILVETTGFTYKPLLGINSQYEDIVIKQIEHTNENLGFIFSGFSGTGKTLTVKNICQRLKLPVIIVNKVFSSEILQNLVNEVNTDVVLFFDEIEKIYDSNDSEQLLSFFDGLPTKNRVFSFLTMNEIVLSRYYFNRPGRFIFNFSFTSLDVNYAMGLFDVPENYKERFFNFLDSIAELSYDIVDKLKQLISIHGWENLEIISKVINVELADYINKIIIDYRINGEDKNYTAEQDTFSCEVELYTNIGPDGKTLYKNELYLGHITIKSALEAPVNLLLNTQLRDSDIEKATLRVEKVKRSVPQVKRVVF